MKSKSLPILTAGLIFCATVQKAQVSSYSFSQSSSSYGAVNSGTMVGGLFQDDDVTTLSLPFTFTFNGSAYTSLDVCSNGYMSFNTGMLSGNEYTPISDLGTSELLAPFGTDMVSAVLISADLTTGSNTLTNCSSVLGYSVGDVLVDYNGDFASSPVVITAIIGNNIVVNQNAVSTITAYDVLNSHGYIKQSVSGSSPNRVLTIEFGNFSRYFIYDELVNFKVRLYETTNVIEFLYGNIVAGQDQTPCEVGLKGLSNSDFNSRKVTTSGSWSNSAASTLVNDVCAFQSGVVPASGQSYMWVPVNCNVSVIGTSTVICSGNAATLTASGATNYTWTGGASTSTTATNVVTPTSNTTYTVMGATGTCTSSATYTVNVTLNPTVTAISSNSLTCPGQSVIIAASGAASYSLNGVAGTSNTFTVSPTITTTYTVSGAAGICVSTATLVQTVGCTGIALHALPEDLNVAVYPNPFSSSLNLKNTMDKEVSVSISDALGKVIFAAKLKPETTQSVPVESLKSGLYFMTVKDNTGSLTKKLIKE